MLQFTAQNLLPIEITIFNSQHIPVFAVHYSQNVGILLTIYVPVHCTSACIHYRPFWGLFLKIMHITKLHLKATFLIIIIVKVNLSAKYHLQL